jgi:hypothetical protein
MLYCYVNNSFVNINNTDKVANVIFILYANFNIKVY